MRIFFTTSLIPFEYSPLKWKIIFLNSHLFLQCILCNNIQHCWKNKWNECKKKCKIILLVNESLQLNWNETFSRFCFYSVKYNLHSKSLHTQWRYSNIFHPFKENRWNEILFCKCQSQVTNTNLTKLKMLTEKKSNFRCQWRLSIFLIQSVMLCQLSKTIFSSTLCNVVDLFNKTFF
jgi:hypothetical protein